MNSRGTIRAVKLLLLLSTIFIASGQDWKTILTGPEADETSGHSLLFDPFSIDPAPSKFFVGVEGGTNRLLTVLDDGANFVAQDFTNTFSIRSIGYDSVSSNLYAMFAVDRWEVRRSSDHGESWSLVDSFGEQYYSGASGFASDNAGGIYVCGNTRTLNGSSTWVVRKSLDQGETWKNVDFLSGVAVKVQFVSGINGGLFVVGSQGSAWIVRRSRDGGATWRTVDSYTVAANGSQARAIAARGANEIYVGGSSLPANSVWIVRVSSNGGDTWNNVYASPAVAQYNNTLEDMVLDSAGNLYVVGVFDAWSVVRKISGVWQDVEYPFGIEAGWVNSAARAVTVDRAGNVLVAGSVAFDGFGNPRRLAVQKLPGTTLTIKRFQSSIFISWPASISGATVEAADSLPASSWNAVSGSPAQVGDQFVLTQDIDANMKFFRLRK